MGGGQGEDGESPEASSSPAGQPEALTRRQRIVVIAVALLCAATRFLAAARSLWEWDEAQFVLALSDFDVTLHQPHPPGFPLFIAAGKAVALVTGDPFRSLQALSLAAGCLLFPAAFLFARELGLRFSTSVASAALLAFLPNVWFFGGTGFSDVPSIVLALFSAGLLLRGARSRKAYWGGTLLLALSAGIRPQNLLIGLAPGIVATRQRRPGEIVLALLIGLTVLGAAFGGAVAATGSLDEFMRVAREHAEYIARVDSWRNPSRPPLWRLWDRFFVKQYQSPALGILSTLLVIVSAAGSFRERSRPMLMNVLTFAPFAVFALLLLDRFSVSRFSIGYQPMFAILLADGIRRAAAWTAGRSGRSNAVRMEVAFTAALVAAFAAFALPAFTPVRREIAPSVLGALAARKHVDPARDRLYVAQGMSRFVDLFAPELAYTHVADDERTLPLGDAQRAWVLHEGVRPSSPGFVFRRERGNLWNIARRHYFEVTLAPVVPPRFGQGWYAAEREGVEEWRAMGARSAVALPPAKGPARLALDFDVAVPGALVVVRLNGRLLDEIVAGAKEQLAYDVTPAPADNLLELTVSATEADARGRAVGLRLRHLGWGAR